MFLQSTLFRLTLDVCRTPFDRNAKIGFRQAYAHAYHISKINRTGDFTIRSLWRLRGRHK